MVRDNKKIRYDASLNGGILIQDYDGVSLYPSAMSKLWITEGNPELIRGKFTEEDFKKWAQKSPEVVETSGLFALISFLVQLDGGRYRTRLP